MTIGDAFFNRCFMVCVMMFHVSEYSHDDVDDFIQGAIPTWPTDCIFTCLRINGTVL